MHKIRKTAICILIVVLSPALVIGCKSCNDNKEDRLPTYNPDSNQPAGANNKENKKDEHIPPAVAKRPPVVEQQPPAVERQPPAVKQPERPVPISEPVDNQAKVAQEKQKNIKKEIIDTEKKYNKSLHVFKEALLNPLKEHFKHNTEIQKFTKELLQAIDELIIISDSLCKDLQDKLASGEVTNKDLGEIFNKHLPFFAYFRKFPALYINISARFEQLKKNKKFKNFLDKLEEERSLNYLTFKDYIIMPIQRVPRYKLMFQDLLKNISQEDTGYLIIQHDLAAINASLDAANTSIPKHI